MRHGILGLALTSAALLGGCGTYSSYPGYSAGYGYTPDYQAPSAGYGYAPAYRAPGGYYEREPNSYSYRYNSYYNPSYHAGFETSAATGGGGG